MKRIYSLIMLAFMATCLHAQENIFKMNELDVTNYDDGRLVYQQKDNSKTKLNGKYKIKDDYRSEYFIAEFKDGMYNGNYEYFKNDVMREKGKYIEGRKDGVYCQYYDSGKLAVETPYVEGKINGIKKTYFKNGSLESEKRYTMNKANGVEKFYDWRDGHELTRDMNYKNGKLEGRQWRQVKNNTFNYTEESNYVNGVLEGEYCETYTMGPGIGKIRQKGMYKNGEKIGKWIDNRDIYNRKDNN